jgi:hypothetical protein
MWDGFIRSLRREKAFLTITGCLLSEAFWFGVLKMAGHVDLDLNPLRSTREDFIHC